MTEPAEVRDGDTPVPVIRSDAGRMLRGCDRCRQVDDHPRHVLGVPAGHDGAVPAGAVLAELTRAAIRAGLSDDQVTLMLAEQLDPQTVVRHPDCCAAAGCYDRSCDRIVAATDRRGDDLVEFLIDAPKEATGA